MKIRWRDRGPVWEYRDNVGRSRVNMDGKAENVSLMWAMERYETYWTKATLAVSRFHHHEP